MNGSLDGTWVGRTASGAVVARIHGENGQNTVDRPALNRFREPCTPIIRNGRLVVDGVPLHRVAVIGPQLTGSCGWYEGQGRRLLLTQFAESSLGEPMVLLAEGDDVVRAYPLSATRLLGENGVVVDIGSGSLQVTDRETGVAMAVSSRFRESDATFHAGGVRLAGTIVRPESVGPHPAAVVVHGAAGGERQFYRLFAQPLLDAGIAVLIYDKPGHGESGGAEPTTIFAQADAASAGMDLLASLPYVDPDRIGLLGFSNGMWAVPMVAARRSDVAFVAGVGSPGVCMADAEVHRRTKVLREAGVGPATVRAAGEAWSCIFRMAALGAAPDGLTDRLADALRNLAAADDLNSYVVPDYARDNPILSPVPPMLAVADVVAMVAGAPDPELTHDPVKDYARMRCPVMLQYGSEDSSVPVDASVRQIEKALGDAGVPATICVYQGLEHLLNVIPDGLAGLTPETAMYGFHHFSFGPGVWRDLTEWLRHTTA